MKQRLIDANALLELMHTYDDYQGAKEAHDLELIHRDSILFAIENAPTVDAVPVVRCGRCEYYSNEMNCCSYVNGLQNVTKTDYCSYGRCADGERRTE